MKARAVVTGGMVAVLAAAGLAGCGDDAPAPDPAPTQATVDQSRLSPDLPKDPSIANPTGAVKDVTLEGCDLGAGEQSIKGTVKSSAKKSVDYVVTVSWINATYDVRGRGITVLKDVKAGSSKEFTVKAKVLDGATQCVTNVQYGKVKGS